MFAVDGVFVAAVRGGWSVLRVPHEATTPVQLYRHPAVRRRTGMLRSVQSRQQLCDGNWYYYTLSVFFYFLKKILEDTSPFCGVLIPIFWTSGDVCPGFQSQGGPSLVCFLICMQWIPQIHLWCDTCWPLVAADPFLIHMAVRFYKLGLNQGSYESNKWGIDGSTMVLKIKDRMF